MKEIILDRIRTMHDVFLGMLLMMAAALVVAVIGIPSLAAYHIARLLVGC